jgi:hypothetical protein
MSFFKTNATAGSNIYGCTATNTWTVEGGGGGLTIGNAVSGGTNNYNLYIDGSGNLAQEQYLGAGRFPALSGDISTTAGSLTTAIGAGKVTNTMLAGSITAANLVGTDIATVGTITTGVWHGTILTGTYGGTGVNNGSSTITLGGNLTTSGAFALTLTTTNTTNVTLPTSGTLLTTTGSGTSLTFPGSLSIATGKTLTASNTLTFTGTDSSSVAFGAGGTVLYAAVTSIATTSPITGGTITGTGTIACATCGVTGTGLNQFASTTSAQLAGVLSDETGSGLAVFGTSPTLTTPAITTSATLSNNNILAVSTDGLVLQNTTASDATNTIQRSPRLHLIGQGWKTNSTAGNQQTEWIIENRPVSDTASPINSLFFVPVRNGSTANALYICQGLSLTQSPAIGLFGLDSGGGTACDGNNIAGFSGIGAANTATGSVFAYWTNGTDRGHFTNNGIINASAAGIMWAASTLAGDATGDIGLCRDAAGIISVYNGGACGTTAANYRDGKFRHTLAAGTAPTIASGFGTSPSIAGSDEAFRVTIGTGGTANSGVVTFGTAYTNAPVCFGNDETTAIDIQAVPTTTNVTINGIGFVTGTLAAFGASDKVSVICKGF